MTVSEYRASLDKTLETLAAELGISKSYLCEIEGANRAPTKVALRIEAHSNGLVNAASLNADVAAARQAA